MAIWQFQFSLIPMIGVKKFHGELISILPEYCMRDPDAPIQEVSDFPNYWEGQDVHELFNTEFARLLPYRKSWSEDAIMFGSDEGDFVEIWNDDVNCSIDMRNFNIDFAISIIEIARKMGCNIVLKDDGRVIQANISEFLTALSESPAVRFVRDPVSFIRKRSLLQNQK